MASLTVPLVLTSPRQDAIDLYWAFKGFGCDSTTVINILAHRDWRQRARIQQEYRAMFCEDLSHRISSELTAHHKKAMLLWILDPALRDATILRQSLGGEGSVDLKAATEILCSRASSVLQTIKQTYIARFGSYLERDITRHTFGDHQKLLLAYVGFPRYEGAVDPTAVKYDAKELYEAGEKRLGTDERKFIRIFTERSSAHLASVASAYYQMYGRSLEKAVKSETSWNFEHGLLTILGCAENPAKYFAKVLHKAMKGPGTNDTTLIRVVVTRTEFDMQYIKAEYHKKYKRSLADAIYSDTSGNYRTFLLSLVGCDRL